MIKKLRAPSPALVVAVIALFVALSGTAVAAAPVVQRALFADNAGKLQRKTLPQVVQMAAAEGAKRPGPASTAAGLVSLVNAPVALNADEEKDVAVACAAGQKVISAGFTTNGSVLAFDSRPVSETTWMVYLVNLNRTAGASGTVTAVCIG